MKIKNVSWVIFITGCMTILAVDIVSWTIVADELARYF